MSEQWIPRPALDKRAAGRLRRAMGQPGRWTGVWAESNAARRRHAIQTISEAGGGDLPSGLIQTRMLAELAVRAARAESAIGQDLSGRVRDGEETGHE